jgi:hypothetical protein
MIDLKDRRLKMAIATSDRSDAGFRLPLVAIKWRKRQKLHTVKFMSCFALSQSLASLSFKIKQGAIAI